MKTAKKLRSPLKWHGGKSYLARRIAALFPRQPRSLTIGESRGVYVEPFAGGLSVLLNNPRWATEYVGDANAAVAMFWQVMSDSDWFPRMFDQVAFQSGGSKPTRETLERAFNMARNFVERPPWTLDVIDRAAFSAFFLTRNRLSRGGLGRDFAWSDRLRGGQPGDLNSWCTMMAGDLLRVHQRMSRVTVHHGNAVDLIEQRDGPDTLFYCDPPYVHSTRTAPKLYDVEMTDDEHKQLLGTLKSVKGKVALSGYRCPLYDTELREWERHEFELPNHSGQGKTKQRRIECVWCNY